MFFIITVLFGITIVIIISKAKHDDLKLKSDKTQQEYQEQVQQLQDSVRELQEQLKLADENKEKALERLKVRNHIFILAQFYFIFLLYYSLLFYAIFLYLLLKLIAFLCFSTIILYYSNFITYCTSQ